MLKRNRVVIENFIYRVVLKNVLKLSRLGHGFIVSGAESGENFEHIYNNKPKGAYFIGKYLDKILLDLPSVQATRNRKEDIKKIIWNEIENNKMKGRKTRVLDLASGGARYLRELKDEHLRGDVETLCIDKDSKCVRLGRNLASAENLKNLRFVCSDIFSLDQLKRLAKKSGWVPNVINSSGLFIYFDDHIVKRVLSEIYAALPNEGVVIFQSYEKLTSRKLMRKTSSTSKGSQWTLYYRKPEYWRTLLHEIGYKQVFIFRDQWLMNNVCFARKIEL